MQQFIWSLVGLQILVVSAIAITALAWSGSAAFFAALLGGSVACLGGLVHAAVTAVFRPMGAKGVIKIMVIAELARVGLTLGLLFWGFSWIDPSVAFPYIVAFVAALMAYGFLFLLN